MSKKLPPAIGRTIDDLRRTKPDMRDETKISRVSLASIPPPIAGVRPGDVLTEAGKNRRNKTRASKKAGRKFALTVVAPTATDTPTSKEPAARKSGRDKPSLKP
jgi:hypothetical protein